VSPSNGATVSRSPTLTWNAVVGATSYRAQVSTSSTFGTLAYDQSVTGTSAAVSGLAGKTTHFWRVNATDGTSTSPWSEVRSFKTRKNN
jgi:hypothetical protein